MYSDYFVTKDKAKCFGCRACENICPKKCITMVMDKETFYYPVIDNNICIGCNLCHKVCPENKSVGEFIEKSDNNFKQISIAAIHSDKSVVFNSASGGAFTAILNSEFTENTVVFGACFDEELKVIHDYSDSLEGASKFRKSKYIQSNTNNSYSKAKEFLKCGKKVVFSGTPCQIAALKNTLTDSDKSNLICIDIICHGVPSQEMFDIHLKELSETQPVKYFQFRYKYSDGNILNSRTAKITYVDGKEKIVDTSDDAFLKAYYSRMFYRPSCKECKFATSKRVSDITLADAWGIEKIYPELDALKGCSLIIANTQKGKDILDRISNHMDIYPVDLNWAINSNEQLKQPTSFHVNRSIFFRNVKKSTFENSVEKALKVTLTRRLILKIKRMLKF